MKVITHHWTLIPIRRNDRRPGRGGCTYAAFKLEDNWKELPVGKAGKVSSDDYWERITYFLERVIPVCKQYDVRMACHPYDPPGFLSAIKAPRIGIRRLFSRPSSAMSRSLTVLTTDFSYASEQQPKVSRLRLRTCFPSSSISVKRERSIRSTCGISSGGLHNFAEVYPDEGVMDFFKIMRILRDTQFAYSICADHMPSHPDDPGRLQAFAFGNGYIKALIDSVNSEIDA